MGNKLTKKLQVLITDDEEHELNHIILNDALDAGQRPMSISSFIRELIRKEISRRPSDIKTKG
jgi:hypothetical protein